MEIDLDIKEGLVDGFVTMNPKNRFVGSDENKAEMTAEFFDKYFVFATPGQYSDHASQTSRACSSLPII